VNFVEFGEPGPIAPGFSVFGWWVCDSKMRLKNKTPPAEGAAGSVSQSYSPVGHTA